MDSLRVVVWKYDLHCPNEGNITLNQSSNQVALYCLMARIVDVLGSKDADRHFMRLSKPPQSLVDFLKSILYIFRYFHTFFCKSGLKYCCKVLNGAAKGDFSFLQVCGKTTPALSCSNFFKRVSIHLTTEGKEFLSVCLPSRTCQVCAHSHTYGRYSMVSDRELWLILSLTSFNEFESSLVYAQSCTDSGKGMKLRKFDLTGATLCARAYVLRVGSLHDFGLGLQRFS